MKCELQQLRSNFDGVQMSKAFLIFLGFFIYPLSADPGILIDIEIIIERPSGPGGVVLG